MQKRVVLMSYGAYTCVVHVWVAESPLYRCTQNSMCTYIFHHMIPHIYSDTLHMQKRVVLMSYGACACVVHV